MRNIHINAEGWTSIDDFYDAILGSLGAPHWHGRNLNALFDSIIGGGINAVEPPYVIFITGTSALKKEILDHIEAARFNLAEVRAGTLADWDRDVDAKIEIVK